MGDEREKEAKVKDKFEKTSRAEMRDVTKTVTEPSPCSPSSAGFWFQWFLHSVTRTLDEGGDSDSWKGPGTKSCQGFEWRRPRRQDVMPARRVCGGGQGRRAADSGGGACAGAVALGGYSNTASEVRVLSNWSQGPDGVA